MYLRLLGHFYFFYNKISQAQNRLQRTKIKKIRTKKHLREKKVTYSLICVLCFYTFSAFSKNGLKKLVFMLLKQFTFTSSTKLDFIFMLH